MKNKYAFFGELQEKIKAFEGLQFELLVGKALMIEIKYF